MLYGNAVFILIVPSTMHFLLYNVITILELLKKTPKIGYPITSKDNFNSFNFN